MNAHQPMPNRADLAAFVGAIFKHADPDAWLALRTYPDRGRQEKALIVDEARIGDPRLVDWIFNRAKEAAHWPTPAVFCPPTSAFVEGKKADEKSLTNGVALSVECDSEPAKARRDLTALLGEPTIVVESGGVWTNPATGEVENKAHLHWRLSEPTREEADHARLKRARRLACAFVGADATAISLVHPLRWPGSVHRKGAPKLARIVAQSDHEIELGEALEILEAACPTEPERKPGKLWSTLMGGAEGDALAGDLLDVAAALAAIPNADLEWADWNRIGMAAWRATEGRGFAAFDAWSQKSPKYDAEATAGRWEHYSTSPPDKIGAGTLFMLAAEAVPGWRRPTLLTRDAQRAAGGGRTEAEQPAGGASGQDGDDGFGPKQGAEEPKAAGKGKSSRSAKAPPPRGTNDDRPVIALRAGEIAAAVDAAEDALIAAGGVYQRANMIVFRGEAPMKTHDSKDVIASRIFEVEEHSLAERIASAACVMKWDARADADVVTNPPSWLTKTLQQRTGRFRLPILTAIINTPTMRPDGTLLDAPGYDELTGLFFDPRGVEFPAIPRRPDRRAAERALADLSELLAGFPFVSEADKAVALSGILTACIRSSLRTAPLHAYSAPTAGSGKGKLVDIAGVVSTGREAGVVAQSTSEEEMEKRLGSMFMEGAGAVAIDNCTAPLDGVFLCAALTQTAMTIRPLGVSRTVTVPTASFLTATGNNLTVAGDMTRRTVVCHLDAGLERPELREFDFEPVGQAKAERVRYVVAALTILLAFQAAGAPQQATPLGSFEAWSRTVRDALIWLGCADPVATMEGARTSDPKLSELSELLAQWRAVIGSEEITVRRVIDKASRQSGGSGMDFNAREFDHPDLREALLAVAGQGGAINGRKLGKWLAAHAKRPVGGAWIEQGPLSAGLMTWKLVERKADPKPAAAPSGRFSRVIFPEDAL